jgi:DNA-binding response OmpR family regulator
VKTILIVEDDISILRGLKDNLEFEGYSVITETNGEKGLQYALSNKTDLILLDIMLPGLNGYEICRRIKKVIPELPIIMITARGSEIDKVSGLDIGADDYVTKPFSISELMARIRALFRRSSPKSEIKDEYLFGNIRLDFKKHQAFCDDSEINLSKREFEIMKYFILHEGEAVHRHDLLDKVWGYQAIPSTRTVDNSIADLRKKIEKNPSNPRYIIGVRGIGYRFNSSGKN